jgi:hypothetical protein
MLIRKNMDVLPSHQHRGFWPPYPGTFFVQSIKSQFLRAQFAPKIIAAVSCFAAISVLAADLPAPASSQISLLREFRPIGGSGKTRRALGLNRYGSFAQLTSDPVLQGNLKSVYFNIDDVDLFMGGLAEKHAPRALVGPTFQAIIADQFQALREGDRFFSLNQGFDRQTASMISATTLAVIMKRNTGTPNLQTNVFIQSALPTHRQPHATPPAVIDTHGRKGSPFRNDGT